MGIDVNGARFLLFARALEVDFSRTAMMGRQALHLQRADLRKCFSAFGHEVPDELLEAVFTDASGYAERLLSVLGALELHSFDNSPFEGATVVHDLNQPVPAEYENRYTAVLDGGCLEHVFNFPVALKSCMEMVSIGGHYLGITPANNFFGHGFYQFSPELFFSAFTAENGFEIRKVLTYEDTPYARWYAVRDPKALGGRVTLTNVTQLYLLVIARRTHKVEIFARPPQQSDYVTLWNRATGTETATSSAIRRMRTSLTAFLQRTAPVSMRAVVRAIRRGMMSPFNPPSFTCEDPALAVRTGAAKRLNWTR
jgi:hypothetical protein